MKKTAITATLLASSIAFAHPAFAAGKPAFGDPVPVGDGLTLDPAALQGVLETDGELPPAEFTQQNAELLREAAPWGQQFPEPLFDGVFHLHEQRIVGEKHLRLVISPESDAGLRLDGIAFNVDTALWPDHAARRARLAYRLDVNEYRGRRSLQLQVAHIEPVG